MSGCWDKGGNERIQEPGRGNFAVKPVEQNFTMLFRSQVVFSMSYWTSRATTNALETLFDVRLNCETNILYPKSRIRDTLNLSMYAD